MDFILNNLLLIIVAFVSGGMLVWPLVTKTSGLKRLTTLQATQMINDNNAILVDVREETQIYGEVIPQAIRLPVSKFEDNFGEVKKKLKSEKNSVPVIILSTTGKGESLVVKHFKTNGLSDLYSIDGGLDAWKQSGLPVKTL